MRLQFQLSTERSDLVKWDRTVTSAPLRTYQDKGSIEPFKGQALITCSKCVSGPRANGESRLALRVPTQQISVKIRQEPFADLTL